MVIIVSINMFIENTIKGAIVMTKIKKLMSIVLVCVLLATNSIPCFAAERSISYNVPLSNISSISKSAKGTVDYVEMTDIELINMMQDLGFTQLEIDTILQLEHERISSENNINISSSVRAFPSNPKEGDWYYPPAFDIHFTTANSTVSGLAAALITENIPAGVAVALASAIINEYMADSSYKAVLIQQSFLYGITNDGVLGWIYGPVNWTLIR